MVELLPTLATFVVAVAALYAARLAARTANERQQKQLAHDRERLEAQLLHDLQRQKEQLDHDREMRERAYARDALDGAVAHATETYKAFANLAGAIFWNEEQRAEFQKLLDDSSTGQTEREELIEGLEHTTDDLREWHLSTRETLDGMYPSLTRLRLHLGLEHKVSDACLKLLTAWEAQIDAMAAPIEESWDTSEHNTFLEAFETSLSCFRDLMSACEGWSR